MNIGIISLGLIGGSLFKCLALTEHNIFVVTRNEQTLQKAALHSANVSSDISSLKNCDIVFVASPISQTLNMLDKLEHILSPDCIVLDCSSVKEFVMEKKRPYKFIGSHPMAGTENAGYDASFKELFHGAKWVLTPGTDISETDISVVSDIINLTGAKIIIADAKEHDKAVALISHMPLLLSQALFHCASQNKLALRLASSGFRDMTRLAMSNLSMAQDMRDFNALNIDDALFDLQNSVEFLKNAKVPEIFADIKNVRSNMYSSEGKNII